MTNKRRRSLLNSPRRASIDVRTWPPRVLDSPAADSTMVDPVTGEAMEDTVSEEPGVEPGSTVPPFEAILPPTLPPTIPTPPPPVLKTPRPSLDGRPERLASIQQDTYTPFEEMSLGHQRPPTNVLWSPGERRFVLLTALLALLFIAVGAVGFVLLWMFSPPTL